MHVFETWINPLLDFIQTHRLESKAFANMDRGTLMQYLSYNRINRTLAIAKDGNGNVRGIGVGRQCIQPKTIGFRWQKRIAGAEHFVVDDLLCLDSEALLRIIDFFFVNYPEVTTIHSKRHGHWKEYTPKLLERFYQRHQPCSARR